MPTEPTPARRFHAPARPMLQPALFGDPQPADERDSWLWVLTVRQPWAHAIVHGTRTGERKDVENRGWAPRSTRLEWLLIHAGAEHDPTWPDIGCPPYTELTYGKIIGAVEYGGVTGSSTSRWARQGEATPGRPWQHWQLGDAAPFTEPYPWRGTLGLRVAPRVLEMHARAQGITPRVTERRRRA